MGITTLERWAGPPGDQSGIGQPYTSPISDPSYSPYYGQTLHEQTEFGGRPPLPAWEQRTWPADPRSALSYPCLVRIDLIGADVQLSREFPTFPSSAYPDPRGGESAYGPASAQVGLETQPRGGTSLLAGEPPTTSG